MTYSFGFADHAWPEGWGQGCPGSDEPNGALGWPAFTLPPVSVDSIHLERHEEHAHENAPQGYLVHHSPVTVPNAFGRKCTATQRMSARMACLPLMKSVE